jgi:hypothetical protein
MRQTSFEPGIPSRLGVSLPQPDNRDSDFRVVEIMNDFDLTGGMGGEGRAGVGGVGERWIRST